MILDLKKNHDHVNMFLTKQSLFLQLLSSVDLNNTFAHVRISDIITQMLVYFTN